MIPPFAILCIIVYIISFYSTHIECFSASSNSQSPRSGPRSSERQHSNRGSRGGSSSRSSRIGGSSRGSSRGSSSRGSIDASTGPKAESSRRNRENKERRRERRQSSSVSALAFDPKNLTKNQIPNHDADTFDLNSSSSIRMRLAAEASGAVVVSPNGEVEVEAKLELDGDKVQKDELKMITHDHFEQLSLDDLFPNLNFSNRFCSDGNFREEIRHAMRKDIFYTTPAYLSLSPKVASYMLNDDSSLQGSWNCIPKQQKQASEIPDEGNNQIGENGNENDSEIATPIKMQTPPIRMTRLTSVLEKNLGPKAPTGDEFVMKIGKLCGVNPSNHWIDIIGVKDRPVSHSWHQDSGKSYGFDNTNGDDTPSCRDDNNDMLENSRYTVMLGFPQEDDYQGTGVFSHAIKLCTAHLAPIGHNVNEPVLFEGTADERYIVRPMFCTGKEILRYRDIDTLHSAPDVVYRKSVMRFM
jgi:hypothetical protein